MNPHALRLLEFEKVLDRLAWHTATGMGRALALATLPAETFEDADSRQTETAEARRLLDSFGGIPLGGAHNLVPHIEKALLAGGLLGHELLEVRDTVASADRLRRFLKKQGAVCPSLAQIADNLLPAPEVEKAITDAIDDAGEVRDSASDKLARLRRDIRTTHGRIQDKLNHIISSPGLRDALQDPVVVSRQGRWCIPVRSSHKGSVPGIVHDASASGATLFIEPQSVVEMANKARELEAAEREEVDRILRALTATVAGRADELRITCSALGHLDLISARALLADEQKAVRPTLRRQPFLIYRQARHPLLKGEVVPIDVRLGSEFKGLLITGPNTGGKTVTLKTVGLLVLMAQSGMQIPAADGSESGIFTDIFADIGDEQSIEQSLSTFSSHVRNIVNTLRGIRPGSLVLFDELGAGTDPAEGAALASAVLEYLAALDVRILATTHYGELKTFAFLQEGFENASVEFDPDTLKPTYRLMIGIPGASHALHIASRLGMPPAVIENARRKLSEESSQSDELIRRVEQSRLRALEEEQKAEAARREAEGLKGRYQADLSKLSRTREQVRDQVQTEAERVIRETQAQLEQVLRELRTQKRHSQNTEGLANKAKRLVKKVEKAVEQAAASPAPAPEPKIVSAPPTRPLRKGDRVRMPGVAAVGTLLQDPSGAQALVAFGAMEVRVQPDQLELVSSAPAPTPRAGIPSLELARATNVSPEIMLRGERVEEALAKLDRYLDDVCLAGLERVRVIHGKGTGVMRRAVWEFMKNHPAVASLEMADATEGGEGATIARLK